MMVLIGIVGAALLNLSAFSVEQKSQAFLRAQAELLARSGTEYAILKIAQGGKINSFNISASPFDINITITYLDNGFPDINGTALIDTVVTTQESLDMPIRYHRRTVQQP